MKRIIGLALALVLIVGAFAGCGGSAPDGSSGGGTAPDAPPSKGTMKIGGTGPLTGGNAIYGVAAKNGAQIAVDEINMLGGIQFELRYEDDENDAEKAVNAYNTLKDWGMQISLSSVTSTPGVATSVENFNDRIFALTPSASSVDVTKGKDNVFQMCFADPNQGSASAQYIGENQLGTKIAVIYKNDDIYSSGIYEKFMNEAKERGLEVVSTTTFTEDSQTDFSVQLADAKNKGADLVFLPIYYTPASLILQQAKTLEYAPIFFGVDGMDGILTLEGFDSALAEGVMLLTPFNADATDKTTVNFVTKYKDAYGGVPNQFAADAYDCIYAIYQAIQMDSTITSESATEEINDKLVAQFTSMSYTGLTGDNVVWDGNGQVSKEPKGMIIQNGAYAGM